MNQHYIAFGITLAALCILVAWMFITSKVSVWTRVSASAVAVCLALCMWWQVTAFLGYATTSQPSDGAVILSFAVLKPVIYLWVMEPAGRAAISSRTGRRERKRCLSICTARKRTTASWFSVTLRTTTL